MVLQKLWVSQNFSRNSWVSQFLSGCVSLAVSIFIISFLGDSIFYKAKLRVLKSRLVRLSVFINEFFSLLDNW